MPALPTSWRRHRARMAFGAAAVALCTILSTMAITSHASATVGPIGNCGTFDMEPQVYWVYGVWGGPSGQLGCPTSNTGITPDGQAKFSHFQNGSIYWKFAVNGAVPYAVLNPIKDKWASMGWETSFLGYPTKDTYPIYNAAGQLGVASEFEGGMIFYSAQTGVHEIHGSILNKWRTLDFKKVGFPTTDQQNFTEGGKVSKFEKGAIYYWPDLGARPVLGQLRVSYRGMIAYKNTGDQWLSTDDETYAIIGAISPTGKPVTIKVGPYDGKGGRQAALNSGDARPENIKLYQGDPNGLNWSVRVMEHDEGNPDAYLSSVKAGVDLADKGLKVAIGEIPVVGPPLAEIAAPLLEKASVPVSKAINSIFGTEDDIIGDQSQVLTAKDMVKNATDPDHTDHGIHWTFKTKALTCTHNDCNYRLFFAVEIV